MNEPDDFFAPRPKLSLAARLLRGYALLAVIGISLLFVPSYLALISRATQLRTFLPWPIFREFVWLALLQTMLVLPFWRCILLRRWACETLCILLCILSWLALLFLVPAAGLGALFPLIVVALFIKIVLEVSPELQSGF